MILDQSCDRLACADTRVFSRLRFIKLGPTHTLNWGNASSKCKWNFNTPFHLTFPNACYCSWPVSEIHLRLVRTVSLKMIHIVLNPNSWNQFSLRISLLARPVHGFGSVQTVRSTLEFSLASCSSRTRLGVSDQTVRSKSKRLWNSQLPVAECFQSPSMLCPKPLQCLSPTLQPQSYQNSSHQFLFATPVRRTKRKAHLYSTNARAHLLFAWTIVAATVEQFIHG